MSPWLLVASAAVGLAWLAAKRRAEVKHFKHFEPGGERRRVALATPLQQAAWVGLLVAAACAAVFLLWLPFGDDFVRSQVLRTAELSFDLTIAGIEPSAAISALLLKNDWRQLAASLGLSAAQTEIILNAAATARHQSLFLLSALTLMAAAAVFVVSRRYLGPTMDARHKIERVILALLFACAVVAIATTAGIILSLLAESLRFFGQVPLGDFLFGTVWDPRFAEAGDDGDIGQFGLLPLLWGTVYISFIAMLTAVPIGLLAAIYLSQYASKRARMFVKPSLEILAGIPTVVYGFLALSFVGPLLQSAGVGVGLEIDAACALSAGLVMGIMIIPFISSLSDDVITAVPQSLKEASRAMGATKAETVTKVIIPAALPGIAAGIILAFSRAVGETMIVVMAAGIAAQISLNPFASLTTVTVKIVSQLTGDFEFNTPQTLVAFALGLALFVLTLGLNMVAITLVNRYRERYE